MRVFRVLLLLIVCIAAASAQNEQSPIVEKEISYNDWTYKSVRDGQDLNLRELTRRKKLVIVVYYAPWCPNWRHDASFLQKFYEKYKASGLEIVGVAEYDPLASMKNNLEFMKVTFPAGYETESREEREKTKHNDYRRSTGDTRKWGSPWYIFIEPAKMEKKGDALVRKTHIINGEMIEVEGEKFIREKLGLPPVDSKAAVSKNGEIEVCDPDTKVGGFIKP